MSSSSNPSFYHNSIFHHHVDRLPIENNATNGTFKSIITYRLELNRMLHADESLEITLREEIDEINVYELRDK